jgi:hypothetical protein
MIGCCMAAGHIERASMTGTMELAIMRRHRCLFALATALTCGFATIADAEVRIEGSLAALRVTTSQDAITDVLSALGTAFNVRYRAAMPLDGAANEIYTGSFGQVVSRLLDGYSYVIRKDQDTTEIIILGRQGEAAVPPPAAKTQSVVSRWR